MGGSISYISIEEEFPKGNIILFDGVCNLCNGWVNFVIDRDPDGYFSFAPLQSDFAKKMLGHHRIDPGETDSIVLIMNGRAFIKSRAALEIAKRLTLPWPLFYVFRIIPGFLRNLIYDLIARNRYRWFGRKDQCRIPTKDLASRFYPIEFS
jgi:predicted DCC family thiol-disulfide oxidoreductase YuxK